MGCITGMIATLTLTAFNLAVAAVGLAVLTLGAILTTKIGGYGDLIPVEPYQILVGLQTISVAIMCLGIFGIVTACCCTNKLFLYIHFIAGFCLVVAVLTLGGIGAANINNGNYESKTRTLMAEDIATFNLNGGQQGDYEKTHNQIYSENECCGIDSYEDWTPKTPGQVNQLPLGCCTDYNPSEPAQLPQCIETDDINKSGCYMKIEDDMGALAGACANLAIFFGVLLFALITTTCLCIKCTNALPI